MSSKKSPCIDICEFRGPKGWCIGCGRTKEECRQWKSLKPYAKNSLFDELKRRQKKMNNNK